MPRTEREIHLLPIRTPDGEFRASYSPRGLCGLDFPAERKGSRRGSGPAVVPPHLRRWHRAVTKALTRALSGQAPQELPPLDLSAGTHFQQEVWRTLRQIAPGEAWSYSKVARAIARPKAVRAVGGACGANPIPVLVPCHRVLAADRRLGGFSAGLDWKRKLLAREGVRPQ